MDEKMETYAVLVLALVVLGWVAYGALGPKPIAPAVQPSTLAAYQGIDASSECGDLNDIANIQHLSHHPDRFADCIKQVDDAKFKEAVGIEKSEWFKQYNIQ
jgi:hypothetical protein